jgi:hypothetical protein
MRNICQQKKSGSFPITSWLLVSCARQRIHENVDFSSVARGALAFIERDHSEVTLVVSPAIDARARVALNALRKTVTPDGVPRSEEYTLPKGYFLLRTFSITGDGATFEGALGPIDRRISQCDIVGREEVHSISLHRHAAGIWIIGAYSYWVC